VEERVDECKEDQINCGFGVRVSLEMTIYILAAIGALVAVLRVFANISESEWLDLLLEVFRLLSFGCLLYGQWKRKPELIKWFILAYIVDSVYEYVFVMPTLLADTVRASILNDGGKSIGLDQLHKMLRHLLAFYGIAAILLFLLDVWICWLAYRTYHLMRKEEHEKSIAFPTNNNGAVGTSASQASTLEAV